jgi:hypothetical protein
MPHAWGKVLAGYLQVWARKLEDLLGGPRCGQGLV